MSRTGDPTEHLNGPDAIALQYETYEDYLNQQISAQDLYYLEDKELARQLVELGYRGSGETMKREEFEERKRQFEKSKLKRHNAPQVLASAGKDLSGFPLLQALADREEVVRNGKLTSIVYIRDRNHKGQEISGYIDYAHRLKTDNMAAFFERKRKFLPKPSDLSFYNWESGVCTSNPTPNFQALADNESGLLFKNKRDRKIINVDPKADPGDNSRRVEIRCPNYLQVVIYDHITRRKT